VGLGC